MVINTIDFPNICLMGQKSDSVCNTVDVWCIKSGMETRPVISHHKAMTATPHKPGNICHFICRFDPERTRWAL